MCGVDIGAAEKCAMGKTPTWAMENEVKVRVRAGSRCTKEWATSAQSTDAGENGLGVKCFCRAQSFDPGLTQCFRMQAQMI
jgi:hypothetical protein